MPAKQMTSKERVLTAIRHQTPDRVPIDYSANAGIDGQLKEHFGLKPNDSVGIRQALNVDFIQLNPAYTGPRLHPELPGRNVHPYWGIRTCWVEHGSGGYWDYCDFPLKDADIDTVEKWPMPSPDDYDYKGFAETVKAHADFCVMTGSQGMGDIINKGGMFRTPEQVLLDLVTEDPAFLRLTDRRMDIDLETMRRSIEAAREGIDMVYMGEDLGTQKSPMISLDLFRRVIRPRLQRVVDVAKSFDLPVMIHSCGSSSWAFDDFIEMGIEVVDTLQPEATNMAPAYLKDKFGDRLAFHGSISTAGPVTFGTPEDVRNEVRETLGIMMPGGGYCLSPTHLLQDNSPMENVLALYEAAMEHGAY
ncbi:hypothetical protein HQ520_01190 [bacterium]|nr:hypothetical protein [bacterium]